MNVKRVILPLCLLAMGPGLPRMGASDCTANFTWTSPPAYIIGTPSGYYGVGINLNSNSGPGVEEVWLIDFNGSSGSSHPIQFYQDGPITKCANCGNPPREGCDETEFDVPSYQEQMPNGGTIQASFGGYGTMQFAGEYTFCGGSQIGYSLVQSLSIPARSTDIDMDGDTDQADKDLLRTAIQTSSTNTARFDFNNSGVIDTVDFTIVQAEMRRSMYLQRTFCDIYYSTGDFYEDGIAPSAISNAAIPSFTCSTLTLQWTAPGDDSTMGTAWSYQMRSSTSPISGFNLGSVVSGTAPRPLTPGTVQTMNISYTATCTPKYYCILTSDGFGNTTFSNNVLFSPCAITDLNIQSVGCTQIHLSWSAPPCGTSYDLRMSGSAISVSSPGTQVSNIPSIGTPPATHQLTVDVGSCTHKYFAIRTFGASGSVSAFGNNVDATTSCNPYCMDEAFPMTIAPVKLQLVAPSPNPSRSTTQLRYGVPPGLADRSIDLSIFDPSGRRIRSLASGLAAVGSHTVAWDLRTDAGLAVRPGVYLVSLVIGGEKLTRRLTVTR